PDARHAARGRPADHRGARGCTGHAGRRRTACARPGNARDPERRERVAGVRARGLGEPVASRFMRVGEQSGRLGRTPNRSARYYDGEISRWLERFTRAFEPALMAAIGLVVGLIVVLLYMPIFDLAGSYP